MINTSEVIRGYSEIIIMSILAKKNSYVYEIVTLVNQISKETLTISNPSAMVILKRMMAEGKVTTYDGYNKRNVTRVYYKLTEKGLLLYNSNKKDFIDSLVSIQNIIEGRFDLNEKEDRKKD